MSHIPQMCPQAAQDAADIAAGKYKDGKGLTQDKADAAYQEAKSTADAAVLKAKEAAAATAEATEGIWNKVPPPPPIALCFLRVQLVALLPLSLRRVIVFPSVSSVAAPHRKLPVQMGVGKVQHQLKPQRANLISELQIPHKFCMPCCQYARFRVLRISRTTIDVQQVPLERPAFYSIT